MDKEIKKIINQIIEGYDPEKIILFGSYANGKPRPASDVDLAVIKETQDNTFYGRLKSVTSNIHSRLGTDILVYTPKEWQDSQNQYFVQEIIKTGKIVYDKES